MEVLILSCSTGGGHNSAAHAIQSKMIRRGHHVDVLDPYTIKGNGTDKIIGSLYIKIVQKTPRLFGAIYVLGDLYRRLPIHSPVYFVNKGMARTLNGYLNEHHYDAIIMPHVYPGEIISCMKDAGMSLPPTFFIATDYTCIPFTEETNADYYIIPSERLVREFQGWGIPKERIVPIGIPVDATFSGEPAHCKSPAAMGRPTSRDKLGTNNREITRDEAKRRLRLLPNKKYLLMAGGSIGAGGINAAVEEVQRFLQVHSDYKLIIISGNNKSLYRKLAIEYGEDPQIILKGYTKHMAAYMKASEVFISKPGGLSSTEAAVSGVPLIHTKPIPGCETRNVKFFSENGMSISVSGKSGQIYQALDFLENDEHVEKMKENQKREINAHAAADICDFVEKVAKNHNKKR